jgi:hypothetical protein
MDVWQIACYVTVFASVAEFVLVIYLTRSATWEEKLIKEKKIGILNGKEDPKVTILSFSKAMWQIILDNFLQNQNTKLRLARNVEQVTRAILPTFYVLFTVSYFLTCFFAMTQPQNMN